MSLGRHNANSLRVNLGAWHKGAMANIVPDPLVVLGMASRCH